MSETTQRSFMAVDQDNFIVTLDDGSQWKINVGDITKVVCWIPTARVLVEEQEFEGFSHTWSANPIIRRPRPEATSAIRSGRMISTSPQQEERHV